MKLDAIGNFARENGLDARPAMHSINGLPALELPSVGRPHGVFAAECGMLLKECPIFARKGCAFTPDSECSKLELVTPTWLRTWVEKYVACYKVRRTQQGELLILQSTMTEDAARVVLQSPQFLECLRRVERFHPCRMPMIRPDGTLELLPDGHDEASATFTAPGTSYDLAMGMDEAKRVINETFGEFPFTMDEGRSKSVAVAALLTVYASGIMPQGSNRPVFLYLGNAEGTGKTTAARIAGICYGAVAVESAPSDESEWQKKLLSAVMGGRRLILLDNLKGFLNSPALEAYTTTSHYNGRILGVTKEFTGEACATVLITGNRLTISPDMRRRSLVVELFMHELRAEDRKFTRLLDEPALLALRPKLLAACWCLVREWDKAQRPGSSQMNSSFPRWCDTIGGIVEFAGFACPAAAAELGSGGDTDTRDIATLGQMMKPGTRYKFAEIAQICTDNGLFGRFTSDVTNDEMSCRAKSSFGKTLKQYDQRTIAPDVRFFVEGEGKTRSFICR